MRQDLDPGLCSTSWTGFTELNIQYDASTFDTDLFEPQPEGPPYDLFLSGRQRAWERGIEEPARLRRTQAARPGCWRAPAPATSELPYTLPQDFTRFSYCSGSRRLDIWLQKLDWIARHGGMALVNVHPDYLCFDGATPNRMEYPSAHYKALLEYVSQHYAGAFWNTTPRKVAQFFADATKVPAASEA